MRDSPTSKFFSDDKRLKAGLDGATKTLKSFSKTVLAIGAVSAAAGAAIETGLGAAVAHFVSTGDELEKMSTRTGMSVEQLSLLKYAAGQSDASLQDIAGAARHMATFMREANSGAKEATDTLDTLGMTFDEIRRIHPDKLFEMFAGAIGKLPLNDIERNAIAVKIFGRNALQLIPMFKELGDLTEEGMRLGQMVTKEDAHNAVELGDAWDRVVKTFKAGVFEVGAALGPDLKAALDVTLAVGQAGLAWVRENRELVKILALIGGGLLVIGAACTAVAATVSLIGFGISSGILPAVAIVAGFWGAIAAAVYLVYSNSSYLQQIWSDIATAVGPAWDAIIKAAKAGELKLAFEILTTQIQVIWDEKLGWLEKRFLHATVEVTNYWTDVTTNIRNAWDILVTGLGKVFGGFTDYIRTQFAELAGMAAGLLRIAALAGGTAAIAAAASAANLAAQMAKAPAEARPAFTALAGAIDPELKKRVEARNEEADALKAKRIDAQEVSDIRGETSMAANRKRLAELIDRANALKPLGRTRPDVGNIEDFTAQGKVGTLGTFSGQTAGLQFGATGVDAQILAENKRQSELLEGVIKAVQESKPAFGF